MKMQTSKPWPRLIFWINCIVMWNTVVSLDLEEVVEILEKAKKSDADLWVTTTCFDNLKECEVLAKPQVLSSSSWDEGYSVWSDYGYCALENLQESMEIYCPRSCGFCQSHCINELDLKLAYGDGACDRYLSAFPEMCRCTDNDCTKLYGGLTSIQLRNRCLKTCYENGDLPYTRPCFDGCTVSQHPCQFPAEVQSGSYSTCMSLNENDGLRPVGASVFGTLANESDLQWCMVKSSAKSVADLSWSFCMCRSTHNTIPGSIESSALRSLKLEYVSGEDGTKLASALQTQCAGFPEVSCILDISELDLGSLVISETIVLDIPVGANLTIFDAHQSTIMACKDSAATQDRIEVLFDVFMNATLILDGITITNCRTAIRQRAGSTLLLQNSKLIANVNHAGYPVVAWAGSQVFTELNNVTIQNNVGSKSGAFGNIEQVGYINFRIKNSTFINNTSTSSGGVVTISNALANVYGGHIEIESCTFLNNSAATHGGVLAIGSGIRNLDVIINDSHFMHNSADLYGGVLYLDDELTNVQSLWEIKLNSTIGTVQVAFQRSVIESSYAIQGGAFYVFDTGFNKLLIENCTLFGMYAYIDGGVAVIHDPQSNLNISRQIYDVLSFHGSQVHHNSAGRDGAVVSLDGVTSFSSQLTVFHNNKAHSSGGVIAVSQSNYVQINMAHTTFVNNTASLHGGGLAISSRTNLTILECTFRGNRASLGEGGAIFLSSNHGDLNASYFSIRNSSRFFENHAYTCGGAISVSGAAGLLFTEGAYIHRNYVTAGNGGAICMQNGATGTFIGLDLQQNNAIAKGGAMYLDSNASASSSLAIVGSNIAGLLGGGIALSSGAVLHLVNNSSLVGNVVSDTNAGVGGGIGLDFTMSGPIPKLFLNETVFYSNAALTGSDIFMQVDDLSGLHANVESSSDWSITLLSGESTIIGANNCSFPDNNSTVPLETPPYSFALYMPDPIYDGCNEIGGAVSGNSLFEMYSGQRLNTLCVVALDVFMQPIVITQDYPFVLSFETSDEVSLDIPSNPTYTFALTSAIQIGGEEIFGTEGNYTLSLQPGEGSFSQAEKFHLEISIHVLPCPSGYVRVTHSSSKIKNCTPSAPLAPPGWYFPDATDLSKVVQCPLGSYRPSNWSALACNDCKMGSISSPDRSKCIECPVYYSVSWNTSHSTCEDCPNNAHCLGGARLYPATGYYHSSLTSLQMHECLSLHACDFEDRLSSLDTIRNSSIMNDSKTKITDQDYREAQCAKGFDGPLCGSCSSGYARPSFSTTDCQKCPSQIKSSIQSLTLIVICEIVFLRAVFDIWSGAEERCGLLKIFLGFMQQIALLGNLGDNWTPAAQGTVWFAGGMSGSALELGCILKDPSIPFFVWQTIASLYVLPGGLLVFALVYLHSRKTCRYQLQHTQSIDRKQLFAMNTVILFFVYPSIIQRLTELFTCATVDVSDSDSEYPSGLMQIGQYLIYDTSFECWTGWHFLSTLVLGLPSLFGLAFAFPVMLCFLGFRNRATLGMSLSMRARFMFVYAGLHHERWYWSLLALARVSLMVVVGVTIRSPFYRNLTIQLVGLAYIFSLYLFQPYVLKSMQQMEVLASTSIVVVLMMNTWMTGGIMSGPWRKKNQRLIYEILILVLLFTTFCALLWMAWNVCRKVTQARRKYYQELPLRDRQNQENEISFKASRNSWEITPSLMELRLLMNNHESTSKTSEIETVRTSHLQENSDVASGLPTWLQSAVHEGLVSVPEESDFSQFEDDEERQEVYVRSRSFSNSIKSSGTDIGSFSSTSFASSSTRSHDDILDLVCREGIIHPPNLEKFGNNVSIPKENRQFSPMEIIRPPNVFISTTQGTSSSVDFNVSLEDTPSPCSRIPATYAEVQSSSILSPPLDEVEPLENAGPKKREDSSEETSSPFQMNSRFASDDNDDSELKDATVATI